MSDAAVVEAETTFVPNEFGPDTRDDFHVLKDGDMFAVFSHTGCMNGPETGLGEIACKDGLYFEDTRILSRFSLWLNRTAPVAMADETSDDTAVFRASLSNTRLIDDGGNEVPAYRLHIGRERFLHGALHERLTITNYHTGTVALDLVLDFWADYRDIFEVRGVERTRRGRILSPNSDSRHIRFGYRTVDERVHRTEVQFDRDIRPEQGRAHLRWEIAPGKSETLRCVVRHASGPEGEGGSEAPPPGDGYSAALAAAEERLRSRKQRLARISTSRPRFDDWLRRSAADLAMLITDLDGRPFPHAGVPWFSAPFGRDAIVTVLQTLWLDPSLAGGVLDFLAATQGNETLPNSDETPGKILHETRGGEMARLGEVPFGRYYGGIDQTLLFVILAAEHYRRTGDSDRLQAMAPAVARALAWARDYGDSDGDGFIEYRRATEKGLRNQGWKDSDNSVFHADGTLCEGPIALVEVQAYHVAALRAAAEMCAALGEDDAAEAHRRQADDLAERLDATFWDEELGTWCMALDGAKRPTRVATSNAGHVLFAGAATDERARRFVGALQDPALMSDWGVRTVAEGVLQYNPMGYHTGSIWPHDNSMIAAGVSRYGHTAEAARITEALFEASMHFHDHRLPELWCGFPKTVNGHPVSYPSACAPQAWAAGAVFLCVRSCLGLTIDMTKREIHVADPVLPAGMDQLLLSRLDVGGERVDLRFVRGNEGVTRVEVLRAPPDIRLVLRIGTASDG